MSLWKADFSKLNPKLFVGGPDVTRSNVNNRQVGGGLGINLNHCQSFWWYLEYYKMAEGKLKILNFHRNQSGSWVELISSC